MYHFALDGDKIVCWNGNDGYTVIAQVVELRPCMHLLRYAQLAEDVENLVDNFISQTSGVGHAVCPVVQKENDSDDLDINFMNVTDSDDTPF